MPGFNPGMPVINKPPIGLTDDEILAVIAYLQTLGGTTTVTMQTKLPYQAGGNGEAAAGTVAPPAAGPTGATGGDHRGRSGPQNAGEKPETPQDRRPGQAAMSDRLSRRPRRMTR